jgi:hypothetical protein
MIFLDFDLNRVQINTDFLIGGPFEPTTEGHDVSGVIFEEFNQTIQVGVQDLSRGRAVVKQLIGELERTYYALISF